MAKGGLLRTLVRKRVGGGKPVVGIAKAHHRKGASLARRELLRTLVQNRAKGAPLQYGLGTEYFGDLEIEVRPGVLIPRSATASRIR